LYIGKVLQEEEVGQKESDENTSKQSFDSAFWQRASELILTVQQPKTLTI
jgi:hypothetical protein